MTANDPSRPSTKWHELDLYLRTVDLEAHFLKDIVGGRESLVRQMHEIHGPNLPAKVQARIKKAMAVDPARKAETLARLYRAEVRRNLEEELRDSGDAALASQIKTTIRMYEEKHDLWTKSSAHDRRAEYEHARTAEQALALARQVQEEHTTPELRAAIIRWAELLATKADTARHFARLPLGTVHDVDLYLLVSGSAQQRDQAIQNLINRDAFVVGGWFSGAIPGRSLAKAELNRLRDERGHTSVYEWLRNVILPAALVLAADDVKARERVQIRIGRRWVLDLDGRQALVEPWELDDDDMAKWVQACVLERVEGGILASLGRFEDQPLSLEDTLDDRDDSADGRSGRRTRLADVIPATEPTPEEREAERSEQAQLASFLEHFRSLPESDQQLLKLYASGASHLALGAFLAATPAAARKRVERLKKTFPDRPKKTST